jgi:hypothetical protein
MNTTLVLTREMPVGNITKLSRKGDGNMEILVKTTKPNNSCLLHELSGCPDFVGCLQECPEVLESNCQID